MSQTFSVGSCSLVLTCSFSTCKNNNLCISLWMVSAKMLLRPLNICG